MLVVTQDNLDYFWGKVKDLFKVNDAMMYKGTYTAQSASGTIDGSKFSVNPTAVTNAKGWTFKVSGSGWFGNQKVESGDMILVNTDSAPGTTQSNYDIIQTNLDGVVVGPSSATSGNLPLFDGTTGKLLKDSGKKVSDFASASDVTTISGYFTGGAANKAIADESGNNIKATYGASLAAASNALTLKSKNGTVLSTITAANLVTVLGTTAVNRVVSSLATTTKFYLTGVTAASGAHYYDSGVYVTATAGCLHAEGNITADCGIAAGGIADPSSSSGEGDIYEIQKTATSSKLTLTLAASAGSSSSVDLEQFSASAAGLVPAFSGTAGDHLLTSSGWTARSSITVGRASSATLADATSNISGGAAGSIPYQTAAGTTAFLAASATNGYVLKFNTSTGAPYWAADDDTKTYLRTQSSGAGTALSTSGGTGSVYVQTTFDGTAAALATAKAIKTWADGAYSPKAGSSSITTVGTITTGTWQGTKIANAYLANSKFTIGSNAITLGNTYTAAGFISDVLGIQALTNAQIDAICV